MTTSPPSPRPARSARAREALRSLGGLVLISATILVIASLVTFLLRAGSGLTPISLFLRADDSSADPEAAERILQQWGLDRPVWQQYLDWVGGALRGDLGASWVSRLPVTDLILQKLPVSVSVALLALLIGVVVGGALGVLAAVRRGGLLDRAITAVTSVFTAVPAFVVGILLIIVFSVQLRWFPAGGYIGPDEDLGGWLWRITLPAVALSLDTVADLARQLRNGVAAAAQGNYALGAVLRGLSPRRVLFGHVLRNGAGPALATLGMKFPFLLGGSILIEQIFSLPGYGVFTTESASYGDVPVVQGALIVSVVLVLVFNLLVNAALNRLSPAARRGI